MAVYYINLHDGKDENSGLSPETAKKHYTTLALSPGDTVLFKCGDVYRDELHATSFVSYGSYGEGMLPTFCGSTDVSLPQDWAETSVKNVWKCLKETVGDVGNFVFNHGDCSATLRWNKEDLQSQGDFWDSRYGEKEQLKLPCFSPQELYMYSQGNPATVYTHIEAASFNTRQLVHIGDGMTFDSLRFINSGVHGMAGSGNNITVRHCVFENIGGCVWNKELQIRFGNGFEIWKKGNNILIENCTFKNIYDSCITHQGPGEATQPTQHFICRYNTFDTYGMAAFEYRDKMPCDSCFTGNTCLNAGCGFAMRGELQPRRSEIWPLPMGHHLFLWRIPEATEGGSLTIEDNHFGEAPVGAALYSIISSDAEKQVRLRRNHYTRNENLLIRWDGNDYTDLQTYKNATGQDDHSCYTDQPSLHNKRQNL